MGGFSPPKEATPVGMAGEAGGFPLMAPQEPEKAPQSWMVDKRAASLSTNTTRWASLRGAQPDDGLLGEAMEGWKRSRACESLPPPALTEHPDKVHWVSPPALTEHQSDKVHWVLTGVAEHQQQQLGWLERQTASP